MHQPPDGDDWFGVSDSELPIDVAYDWAIQPSCGAVVLFSGTIRDHADGRSGVEHLTYEAYEERVVPRFAEIGVELRRRWPDTGRVALLHRLGRIEIGESSVIAVVVGLGVLAAVVVLPGGRRRQAPDDIASFRRQIDALSPEARRQTSDRMKPSDHAASGDDGSDDT